MRIIDSTAKLGCVAAFVWLTAGLAAAQEYRWGGTPEPTARTAPARSEPTRANIARSEPTPATTAPSGPILREADIAGLRVALNLTPEQRQHWTPVEAALSVLARHQARAEATGYVQRFRDRASALAATAAQLHRLRATAMPLINTLNEHQKRAALSFARRMGYGPLLAMF